MRPPTSSRFVSSAFVLSSTLTVLLACSSDDGEGEKPRQCLAAPAPVDLASPTVSFKATIAPLIEKSCAFSTCHGDPNTSLGIYLPPDAAQIYKSLKGPAPMSFKLDFVKAAAPGESFLMHKLDGTQCGLDKDCVNGSCGNAMPPEGVLSVADRDAIRRWIAQGALDN